MTAYFLDTSALVRRYIPEVGSVWLRSWIEPVGKHIIIVSELTIVELMAALARRQREGSIPTENFIRLRNDFLTHFEKQYSVVALRSDVLHLARDLVTKHPLRTLDAIQLAGAMMAAQAWGRPLLFISADRKMLSIAAAEGFSVDDPNDHP